MIYPEEFLRSLDRQRNKIIYARIISLSYDEHPLETIEGRVTSGSLNLDGASAIRRTCQLSIVATDVNISDYLWGLKTKFKLAVGVENQIDKNYPDIIWFEQGIYIITSFSTALNSNSYTINISGKDKMCLLNGEIGGNINASTDFGTVEQEIEKGVWKKVKLPVKDIIREMVHAYAGESFHNIIINDLDSTGLTLQNYNFKEPMYLFRQVGKDEYSQAFVNGEQTVKFDNSSIALKNLIDKNFVFESLLDLDVPETSLSQVEWANHTWHIAKIDYGETAGYTEGDLVYPTDLMANIGETITSVLDKIKTFLGEFEYFYNLHGQFVFQKKRIYVQNTWNPVSSDGEETYIADNYETGLSYIFSGTELFTAFNNTPNLNNVKNDFSVWGTKGEKTPIHMRYAIDKKPVMYNSIEVKNADVENYNIKYGFKLKGQSSHLYIIGEEYLLEEVKEEEIPAPPVTFNLRPVARTPMGILYLDLDADILRLEVTGELDEEDTLQLHTSGDYNEETNLLTIKSKSYTICDWREIIYQMALDYNKYNHLDDFEQRIAAANPVYFPTGRTGYEQYYTDMQGFWRLLYNLRPNDEDKDKFYSQEEEKWGWAKQIYEQPEQLLFWFDFMDTEGDLAQFSVPAIGSRTKVVNDNQVKAIIYKDIPNVIFQSNSTGMGNNTGYRYFNAPNSMALFRKSAQGKSAKEEIDNLLYQHGYCVESVSITSIPIYYLDTNTRIYINDEKSGIEGEYIISKISMPFSYNGTMSITATKAADRLL